jgi:hypothetical protein
VHPDLAVVRVAGQADHAAAWPGGSLVVLDPAAAGPAEVPVIHLVALGEQQLELVQRPRRLATAWSTCRRSASRAAAAWAVIVLFMVMSSLCI